uniref:DDE Tnp4 domain-containing protein n=1 Tax=Plectus sambesii TaxID=2011161 RepID=A0A914WM27_9BILA
MAKKAFRRKEKKAVLLGLRALQLGIALYRLLQWQQRRVIRRFSVKPSHYGRPSTEMLTYLKYRTDDVDMKQYLRLTTSQFDNLHSRIEDRIQKFAYHRFPISSEERLVIALRHFAHGLSYPVLAQAFQIGATTVREIVNNVSQAIIDVLGNEFMGFPSEERWKEIESEFRDIWQFPMCVGAMDGKHFRCQAPNKTGSAFFNYKEYFSVVLLALVDAHYRFTYVDIGGEGRQSDSSLYAGSDLRQAIQLETAKLPPPADLPGIPIQLPPVIVADEGFGLDTNVMRPFSRSPTLSLRDRIFNYRLSRARRISENTFGVLVNRWRLFRGELIGTPASCRRRIHACLILHNYVRSFDSSVHPYLRYIPPGFVDREEDDDEGIRTVVPGEWRSSGVAPRSAPGGAHNFKASALKIRDHFANYFESPSGSVPWQLKMVLRGLI